MNGSSISPEMLQRGYEATRRLLIELFSSDEEVEVEVKPAPRAIAAQTGYLGISEVSAFPVYTPAASCSIFRVGERETQTFTIVGLMLMLYGSCNTVAVGARSPSPSRDVKVASKPVRYVEDDPFTTMNGYGDKVY